MATWGNIGNIEVAAGRSWKQARYSVASIDASTGVMTMDAAGWNDDNTQPTFSARRDAVD